MDEKILKELQEIKKLLQVIVSNQEQSKMKSSVTVKIADLVAYKRLFETLEP